jgi:hypothetical protein
MTYQEEIHAYPPEQWVKGTEDRDGYCAVCEEQGQPCRDRIICDIADIQDCLEATGLFIDDMVVLTFLHELQCSSLTHSAKQMAQMFLKHPHAVPDSGCKNGSTGAHSITSLPPTDADIYQELALAGAHN